MDYFGHVLDELTEMWEQISASPHAADAASVLKALEKTMRATVAAERSRTKRGSITNTDLVLADPDAAPSRRAA